MIFASGGSLVGEQEPEPRSGEEEILIVGRLRGMGDDRTHD